MADLRREFQTMPAGRRQFLRSAGWSLAGLSACRWLPAFAEELAAHPDRRRQCILLWMSGGPSQLDTFDMKPNHPNGGEFKETSTSVPGLRISEHLPRLAEQADQLALVRGLSTKEGDHLRGTQRMRTGKPPGGPIRYPDIGSTLSKALANSDVSLPNYISIGSNPLLSAAGLGPGFLGPRYAATSVGQRQGTPGPDGATGRDGASEGIVELGVDHLTLPDRVTPEQIAKRRELWASLQSDFLAQRNTENAHAHDTVYRRAMRMMDGAVSTAFDLSLESTAVRESYGKGVFGQGCLLARRLIERGVPFVEVNLDGWDTHQNNFRDVQRLSGELDAGWGTLMRELRERSLLGTTTILWMGEFGRTPVVNGNAGRDHFPQAWTCVLAGGGIAGGQAYGQTSPDGSEVLDGQVDETHVLATLCRALGIDPHTENYTRDLRPVKIVEGEPVAELLS
ncbi:MAG: DUF1501 domain-containing protein [Planctomycetales bacterium]|nr:DUF1501 domain-containing protein [Planctomycetales bacterium]